MSFYADYIKERTDDHIFEDDRGFITWRYLNDKQCYIIDLFVKPEYRNQKVASQLADSVARDAREKGCKELLGTIVPSTKNSNDSLKVLQAYGMVLDSAEKNLIVMRKDL